MHLNVHESIMDTSEKQKYLGDYCVFSVKIGDTVGTKGYSLVSQILRILSKVLSALTR